jgi:uncharacterized membrane protein YsdA (DUF1294 family)
MIRFLLLYLLLVNAVAFLIMLVDKRKAVKKKWRIPEATLLFWAAIGGSVGELAGMYVFRHKTKHPRFTLGVPAILIAQIALGLWLWTKFGT